MGCMDGECPFLHDEEMFRKRREKILAARRKALFEPTPRQRILCTQKYEFAMNGMSPDDTIRHFCANEECAEPWLGKSNKGDSDQVFQKCARCQWTYYCSVSA